jgi:hypothetical protein
MRGLSRFGLVKLVGDVARHTVQPRLKAGRSSKAGEAPQDLEQRLLDELVQVPAVDAVPNQNAPDVVLLWKDPPPDRPRFAIAERVEVGL